MTLDLATLRSLDRLLDEALDLPAPSREAWLDELAGDDARHAPLLRELLLAPGGARTADWLDHPPLPGPDPFGDRGPAAAEDLAPGRLVGPWRLVRELGVGGMGSVWLAQRIDGLVSRPVALKLPHFGARPRAIAGRFAREREILATLAHPNIARLYDAGIAADGQPWLAMEYVEGRPITEWADARGLSIEARVTLFRQVLRAVQHAHANLVVHRDLKPSNILVTDAGEARLLDFGIAKLVADGEARETELTRIAGRALTPSYASPEQIAGAPISTASDVYSLGVVLYELLAGRRPYRNGDDARALERAILEDEPPRASASATDEAARSRGAATARRLARALSGDLDTIVGKALAKRPDERYATVAAFAADLERHLAGDPIEARGVDAWRRALRFAVRHRVAAGATAAIAVALVAGAAVALWQANEARREAARASAVQAFLIDLFRTNNADQADPLRARNTTARELLDRGAGRLGTALADQPAAKEAIADTLAKLYRDLGLTAEASDAAEARLAAARRLYGPRDPRLGAAIVDAALALALREPVPVDRGRALVAEARGLLAGEAPGVVQGELEYVASRLASEAADPAALDAARRSVAILRAAAPDDPQLVRSLDWLALLENRGGQGDAASATIHEAVELARRIGLPPPRMLRLMLRAGELYSLRDEVEDADRTLGEAYALSVRINGPGHPTTLSARRIYLRHLAWTGRTREAEVLAEGLVDDVVAAAGGREPALVQETRRIAVEFLLSRGRLADAERVLADATAAWGSAPESSFELADHLTNRARTLTMRGRTDEARRDLDAAGAIVRRLGYPAHSMLAVNVLLAQARADIAAGSGATDERALERALEAYAGGRGSTPMRVVIGGTMAELAVSRGRASEGEALARRALDALDVPLRPYLAEEDAYVHLALGEALAAQGRCAEALPAYAPAVVLYRRLHVPDSPWLGEAYAREAACLFAAGRAAEGRERLASARAIYAKAGPLSAPMMQALAEAESPARTLPIHARR